jgi:molecular chaperone DnaK (HSP70)
LPANAKQLTRCRKTAVLVGFERDGELRTGDDAISLRARAPERCVYGFMELLGEQVDSEAVKRFRARNPQFVASIVPTPRGTIAFEVPHLMPA